MNIFQKTNATRLSDLTRSGWVVVGLAVAVTLVLGTVVLVLIDQSHPDQNLPRKAMYLIPLAMGFVTYIAGCNIASKMGKPIVKRRPDQ